MGIPSLLREPVLMARLTKKRRLLKKRITNVQNIQMFIIYMAFYIQHGTGCYKKNILKYIAICTNCVIELWL